ncbi:hypothetical protein ACFFJX_09285 [Pseudarcicella hirudinis]|uniref:hypothetical protein n=1 Tax=Pseudarcicella hirudinis TaxID=1079859 RepID=UPI0035E6CE18
MTTVNGVKTFNKAKTLPTEKIFALRVTTLDNLIFEVPRGSWTVAKNFQMADNQIMHLACEVEVTDTGFVSVPDYKWTQPATT